MNRAIAPKRAQALRCPTCGLKGKPVKTVTLHALLKPQVPGRITQGPYRFCDALGCDTVYYAEDGSHLFSKSDMTVRVGVKETEAPRHVCYCFDHTIEEIEDEAHHTGRSTVLDDIKSRMKAACWCETKNPQGCCCLGTVSKYVKQALEKCGQETQSLAAEQRHELCCAPGSDASGSAGVQEASSMNQSANKVRKITQVGALGSAIIASACCWLPLLLVALGVSGVAVSATLEQYRPIFLAVTFALLGIAFYFTYGPRPVIPGSPGAEACHASDGEMIESTCCPPEGKKGLNLGKFNKVMLWIVTAVALAFAFFPNYVGLMMSRADTASADTNLRGSYPHDAVLYIAIEGMTCEACASRIRASLKNLPAVKSATVSFANKKAKVVVDKDSVDKVALTEAIESAGYKVAQIRRENE